MTPSKPVLYLRASPLSPRLPLRPADGAPGWVPGGRGIEPLSEWEEGIRARDPDDLSPLDEKVVPLEVAPLVSSVNDLLTRLKASIATQKRFLANAAHQLKTPLAGLRTQAEIAVCNSSRCPVGVSRGRVQRRPADFATRSTPAYGRACSVRPEPAVDDNAAPLPGPDGLKMGKGSDNTTRRFATRPAAWSTSGRPASQGLREESGAPSRH